MDKNPTLMAILTAGDKPADRVMQPIFTLGKTWYVPHYKKSHLWVAQDGTTKSTRELRELKARQELYPLWPRSWAMKLNLTH